MACCLVFAAVIAWFRRAWALARPGAEPIGTVAFPPTALRSAPGALHGGPVPRPSSPEADTTRTGVQAGDVPRAAALGVIVYAVAVAALLRVGAAESYPAPNAGWPVRNAVLVTLAAGCVFVAHRGGTSATARERIAVALMGLGAMWFLLGVLDQHAFTLFEIAGGNLVWDAVFHGMGTTAFAVGWALVHLSRPLPAPQSVRPMTTRVAGPGG